MRQNILFLIGIPIIAVLSAYLGYLEGVKNGVEVTKNKVTSVLEMSKYGDSLKPLVQAELLYEISSEENPDSNIKEVSYNMLQENLETYKKIYSEISPEIQLYFEDAHYKNVKRIEKLK